MARVRPASPSGSYKQEDILCRIHELERKATHWEQRYEQLLDGLPVAIYVQDQNGNIIRTNAAGEQLSGFNREQLLGMNVRQLLTPESYAAVMNLLGRTPPNQHCSTDAELFNPVRRRVSIDLSASIRCDDSGIRTIHFVARENTTRKVFEEALRHSETTFRLMATNLTEMVLAYDMERRLMFANPAAEKLTGYSIAELETAQFICWVHPDDRDRMLSHWDKLFIGQSFHEEEYRLVTKDGRLKWVAASWGPILDNGGGQIGVQGRERDVTEAGQPKRPCGNRNTDSGLTRSVITLCLKILLFLCGRRISQPLRSTSTSSSRAACPI